MTFRRFVVGWTLLAVVAWLLLAGSWGDQAGCRDTDFVCLEPEDVGLIAAVTVGIAWFFGLFLVCVVVGLVRWRRKLSSAP